MANPFATILEGAVNSNKFLGVSFIAVDKKGLLIFSHYSVPYPLCSLHVPQCENHLLNSNRPSNLFRRPWKALVFSRRALEAGYHRLHGLNVQARNLSRSHASH
jgi:hypothetical protein